MTELNEGKRGEIVDRVIKMVEARFYDSKFNGVDIRGRLESAKPEIIRKGAVEDFETAVNEALKAAAEMELTWLPGSVSQKRFPFDLAKFFGPSASGSRVGDELCRDL